MGKKGGRGGMECVEILEVINDGTVVLLIVRLVRGHRTAGPGRACRDAGGNRWRNVG